MILLRVIFFICLGIGALIFIILVEPTYIGIRDANHSLNIETNEIVVYLLAIYISGAEILIYSIVVLYIFFNRSRGLLIGGFSVIAMVLLHFIFVGFVGHGYNNWLYLATALIEISIQYCFCKRIYFGSEQK